MMNVTVKSAPIGVARLSIDLGHGNTLHVEARHDADRYRQVSVKWEAPALVRGTTSQVRDRQNIWLVDERLDLHKAKVA